MKSLSRRRLLLDSAALTAAVAGSRAVAETSLATPQRIELWPGGVPDPIPDALRGTGLRERYVQRAKDGAISDRVLEAVTMPFIEVHRPERPLDAASILLMPGGGYRYMAWDKEGDELARWFAARGVTAFILAYRLPLDGWASGIEAPLADAQRALRLIRHRSSDFGLDPERIAALGFSAGGHLCANLAASYARAVYPARDPLDRLSCRPALAAPVYPAVKLEELPQDVFGSATTPAMRERNSPPRNVPQDAPPHFLLHAEDDPLVGAEHALALRAALVARGITVETHLFAKGGHGFGIRLTRGLPVDGWPERLLAFGRNTGWLKT